MEKEGADYGAFDGILGDKSAQGQPWRVERIGKGEELMKEMEKSNEEEVISLVCLFFFF